MIQCKILSARFTREKVYTLTLTNQIPARTQASTLVTSLQVHNSYSAVPLLKESSHS